jgi:hypothetical protein
MHHLARPAADLRPVVGRVLHQEGQRPPRQATVHALRALHALHALQTLCVAQVHEPRVAIEVDVAAHEKAATRPWITGSACGALVAPGAAGGRDGGRVRTLGVHKHSRPLIKKERCVFCPLFFCFSFGFSFGFGFGFSFSSFFLFSFDCHIFVADRTPRKKLVAIGPLGSLSGRHPHPSEPTAPVRLRLGQYAGPCACLETPKVWRKEYKVRKDKKRRDSREEEKSTEW